MTSLMHAAYCGHFEACQLLLNKRADVNNTSHTEGVRLCVQLCVCIHNIIIVLFSTLL